ncbi:MAG: hypothetical protein J6Y48_11190, partial [Clostridia bacterium]|nr:hypothetical protein [Clostridia bacterium]
MKKLLCLLLALALLPLAVLAEEAEEEESTGSWSQINQAVTKVDSWLRFAEGDAFRLGDAVPLEGSDSL